MGSKSAFESMCSYLNEHKNGVITIETDFLHSPAWPMMKLRLSVGNRHVYKWIPFYDVESELLYNNTPDRTFKRVFEDMCDTIDKMEAGDESICY